jgi:hypothetical protein
MTDFSVKVTLPSSKTIRIKELNNRLYSHIVKFCENGDYEGLSNVFENDILECSSYNIIDKFYILLLIRILFIGDTITISGKDNTSVEYSLSIILDKIEKGYEDLNLIIKHGDFEILLGLPNIIYFEDIDSLYNSVIYSIKYNNETIDFKSLNAKEQNMILNRLPGIIFKDIKKYVDRLSKHFDDFTIVDSNESLDIKQYKINLISNGLISFLMRIFSNGLDNYYNTLYIIVNKIRAHSDLFFDLTPVESVILINKYEEDIQRNNKELQKQERDIN